MNVTLESAAQLCARLASHDVETILYGSLGVSVYLGAFKPFGDVDLLVESVWLGEQWPQLQHIMQDQHFVLTDIGEHEFKNDQGVSVAFADKSILVRDNILNSPQDIVAKPIGSMVLTTLSPEAFKRAYEFSKKDGYRRDARQKNDDSIIKLLGAYIEGHPADYTM